VLTDFWRREQVTTPLADLWVQPSKQQPSALCLLRRDDRMLLLRRRKEPLRGYWTVPGGKLEPGEDPARAAQREIREETGFLPTELRLLAIASELGPRPLDNWLLIIFTCSEFTGVQRASAEGELGWFPRTDLATLPMHEVDLRLWAELEAATRRCAVRIRFGHAGELADMEVRPL
jgi:ADP-ribose pyrophosphatase YjhB (NUDIX family)